MRGERDWLLQWNAMRSLLLHDRLAGTDLQEHVQQVGINPTLERIQKVSR
jgi:hypothetical protein